MLKPPLICPGRINSKYDNGCDVHDTGDGDLDGHDGDDADKWNWEWSWKVFTQEDNYDDNLC